MDGIPAMPGDVPGICAEPATSSRVAPSQVLEDGKTFGPPRGTQLLKGEKEPPGGGKNERVENEMVPYDVGPAERAPGVPFSNVFPRSTPDPIAMAVMSDVTDGEEYLSLLVRFAVITEAEAEAIRAEVAG